MSAPGEDFIFRVPRKIREKKKKIKIEGRTFPPGESKHKLSEEEAEWANSGVYAQIKTTYETIVQYKIKDDEKAYFLIETANALSHPTSTGLLERFNAEVLMHLDPVEYRALVSSPYEIISEVLKHRVLKEVENNIVIIRPLKINDVVSEINPDDREWSEKNTNIIIKVIPNLAADKTNEYLSKTKEIFTSIGIKEIENYSEDYLNENGMIFAEASYSQCIELINETNLVYKILKTPKIIPVEIGNATPSSQSVPDTIESRNILYPICIVDTGLNSIPQLNNLIIDKTYEPIFNNGDDIDNHGTPIACLVAFGEGNSGLTPKFRLMSHRIFSRTLGQGDLSQGLMNSINLYKDRTKIFISSTIFRNDTKEEREITETLNSFIQKNNICVVFSSGNIVDRLNFPNYPNYIDNYKVNHPSDALTITSVGSIAKKTDPFCVAQINQPSPFTRCGSYTNLENSIKPEITQHGGNLNARSSFTGIGVSMISHAGTPYEDIGTSFSSPQFARILGAIQSKYYPNINNAETLKAIAYSSSKIHDTTFTKYVGFGEAYLNESIVVPKNRVKIIIEDEIPLDMNDDDCDGRIYDEINFSVPQGVREIVLTLVHSDNYLKYMSEPKLHTFFSIACWKPGRVASLAPSSILPGVKAHSKKIIWRLSRGTIGRWRFLIKPRFINIPKIDRNNVILRYGAVFELISPRLPYKRTLTDLFKQDNGMS